MPASPPISASVLAKIEQYSPHADDIVEMSFWRKSTDDRGRYYFNLEGLRDGEVKIWIQPERGQENIQVRVRPQIGKLKWMADRMLSTLTDLKWCDLRLGLHEAYGPDQCNDVAWKLNATGQINIPDRLLPLVKPGSKRIGHVNPTSLTRDQLERKSRNWLCKAVSDYNLAQGKSLWHARKSELLDLIVDGTPVPEAPAGSGTGTPPAPTIATGANPVAPVAPPVLTPTSMSDEDRRKLAQDMANEIVEQAKEGILETIEQEVKTRMDQAPKSVQIIIKKRNIDNLIKAGEQHARFQDVMECVEAGIPVMLVGPAGSGKTTLAAQIAEAMGLKFTFNSMSAGVTESSLFGRLMPPKKGTEWEYHYSPFSRTYEEGGVHLFDEMDAADPNLLVSINAAIANNFLSIPFTDMPPIKRHEDTVIISAANTFGKGANRQYAGRNKLDDATLDRFAAGTIEVDYDPILETRLVNSIMSDSERAKDLLEWAWAIRERIERHNIRRLMSTRFIKDAAALLECGKVDEQKITDRYFVSWSKDEEAKVNQ